MRGTPIMTQEEIPWVHVLAGVLVAEDGRVLLAQRPPGKAFAGRWEFPGGKREPGESPREALERELREELGIEVLDAEPLLCVRHRYPDSAKGVIIDSWRVTRWQGTPASLDGQELQWRETSGLPEVDILEADRPIVTALRLPAWIVRGALEAPNGARSLRVAATARDVPLDPDQASHDGIAIWSSAALVHVAESASALSGCVVTSAGDAAVAKARGADFLLVPQDPGADELRAIGALGLPWYLETGIEAPVTAQPTGRLRWT